MAAYKGLSQAHAEGNARYDAKTYKNMLFKLRLEDDSDILASIAESQAEGVNKREWLRALFDGSGVSLKKVRKVLEKYDVDPRIADKIIDELK